MGQGIQAKVQRFCTVGKAYPTKFEKKVSLPKVSNWLKRVNCVALNRQGPRGFFHVLRSSSTSTTLRTDSK